jgi:hypothetical protein
MKCTTGMQACEFCGGLGIVESALADRYRRGDYPKASSEEMAAHPGSDGQRSADQPDIAGCWEVIEQKTHLGAQKDPSRTRAVFLKAHTPPTHP